MLVSFEYNDKIIANAELQIIPVVDQVVKIWNENYTVSDVHQDIEIKMKNCNKKSVTEKIICVLKGQIK